MSKVIILYLCVCKCVCVYINLLFIYLFQNMLENSGVKILLVYSRFCLVIDATKTITSHSPNLDNILLLLYYYFIIF